MGKQFDMADLFGLQRTGVEQFESLVEWEKTGKGELEPDPDWHVPTLLGEEARLLGYHFQERTKATTFEYRKVDERSALELERYKLFRLIDEHLSEKYREASRTLDLLREIQSGKRGFVLLLWGFGTRTWRFGGGTMSSITLRGQRERDEIGVKLAPTPLVWISDPIESGALELESERRLRESGNGFRIESGRNWEENVSLLIGAASFIIVQNAEMTPGVVREIERVRDQGRLPDAFFKSPENAQQLCPGHDLHPLTEESIGRMRGDSVPRPSSGQSLPEPTCLWVEGARRERLTADLAELFNHLEGGKKFRTPIPFDWCLDAYYSLVASAVLLERLDLLVLTLERLCIVLSNIPVEEFESGETLCKIYGNFQQDYISALKQVSPEQPLTAQLERAYRYLRTRPRE